MCTVAVVAAAGGLVAGRAFAEDPMPGGAPPMEKAIDGHALVKALTANGWTVKGDGAGTSTFRLGANKTVLVQDYTTAGGKMGPYGGVGATKVSADGKTATMWWFHSMGAQPMQFTGPITDTGYELSGDVPNMMGAITKATVKLTKKGEGYEFTYVQDDQTYMTDTYTKAK
jgi:hypothetical protein